MLEYNGIKMELVSIDRFEREEASSSDGVDHLWNQYNIQITAIVHYSYLNTAGGPYATNNSVKQALMEKRKKFKFSFVTGGTANNDNRIASQVAFGEAGGIDQPFILNGPIADSLGQNTIVPDTLDNARDTTSEVAETEILIESPPTGAKVDAHNGPDPIFCHITEFLGTNGFVITWAIRTWLVECLPGANPSPVVSNRFDQIHDVDDDQVTTITTYGTVVFRTDLLYAANLVPDDFRGAIMAPIFRGFRRARIQVKQMSDTTVKYLTIDRQTPVVFNPVVPNAIRAEVINHRILADKDAISNSVMAGFERYYSYRANRNWAKEDRAIEHARADKLLEAQIATEKAAASAHQAKADHYKKKGGKP